MFRSLRRIPADVGTERSPILTPVRASMYFTLERSFWGASKRLIASSETNFTCLSGPIKTDATPAVTRRLTTLVMAGDADSTGKGRMGALGKDSTCAAGDAAERGGPVRGGDDGDEESARGGALAVGVSTLGDAVLPLRGLSHF